jgi:hypothetical protein
LIVANKAAHDFIHLQNLSGRACVANNDRNSEEVVHGYVLVGLDPESGNKNKTTLLYFTEGLALELHDDVGTSPSLLPLGFFSPGWTRRCHRRGHRFD